MIAIGKITKPQGIRGEVKVMPMTDDPSRFCMLKCVYIGNRPYRIESVRVSGGDVYLKLVDIDDRNAAESLRGKSVEIDRVLGVPLADGEFYIADLVGARLYARSDEENISIGVIERIDSYGAADVFTVSNEERTMTFAFVKSLSPVFDEGARALYVDGDRLKEVAVYED